MRPIGPWDKLTELPLGRRHAGVTLRRDGWRWRWIVVRPPRAPAVVSVRSRPLWAGKPWWMRAMLFVGIVAIAAVVFVAAVLVASRIPPWVLSVWGVFAAIAVTVPAVFAWQVSKVLHSASCRHRLGGAFDAEQIGARRRFWLSALRRPPFIIEWGVIAGPMGVVGYAWILVFLIGHVFPKTAGATGAAGSAGPTGAAIAQTVIELVGWSGLILGVAVILVRGWWYIRPLRRRLGDYGCPLCGYQLADLSDLAVEPAGPPRCPECGVLWPLVPPPIPEGKVVGSAGLAKASRPVASVDSSPKA